MKIAMLACLGLAIISCTSQHGGSACISCHGGLESASASHSSCISCHKGGAAPHPHQGMLGSGNPAAPPFWEDSCGACHHYQLNRVKSTIMQTGTGMIRNIQLTWDGEDGKNYSAGGGTAFDDRGTSVEFHPVAELDNLSGELFRKFCSRCHVGVDNDTPGSGHAAGCAACHFPFNDAGAYAGGDWSMRWQSPRSASHRLTAVPGNDVCFRCHNRSGRIALSYQGLYDGNNGMVPTRNGLPGPVMASGNRNLTHIAADVHFAAGMDCIDCHTSRDVMGDGYSYRNMYLQTEISCEDCHGGKTAPRYREITRENDEAVRESKQYRIPMRPGTKMVITAKGRSYSNVFYQDGVVKVVGKRSGKLFTCKVVTGTAEHAIRGHGRMECHACHSRTVVQCYGCHTMYDRRKPGMDFIGKKETPGEFSETEDYRMLYPFPWQ